MLDYINCHTSLYLGFLQIWKLCAHDQTINPNARPMRKTLLQMRNACLLGTSDWPHLALRDLLRTTLLFGHLVPNTNWQDPELEGNDVFSLSFVSLPGGARIKYDRFRKRVLQSMSDGGSFAFTAAIARKNGGSAKTVDP